MSCTQSLRPRIAVDWDDTCVDGVWPAQDGDWKPGAVEALREISQLARVVIHTTRIAPVMPEKEGYSWRPDGDVEAEILAIREKLDSAGLQDVIVWTKPWKPDNCIAYVDDKGVHYDGNWEDIREELCKIISESGSSKKEESPQKHLTPSG